METDIFDYHYYKLLRILLSAVGLWPYLTTKEKTVRKIIIFLILGVQSVTVGIDYFSSEWSLNLFAETGTLVVMFGMAFIKYAFTCFYARKVQRLLDSIKDSWVSAKSAEEQKIAEAHAERGGKYIGFGAAITSGACILFCCSPFSPKFLDIIIPLNETRPLRLLFRSYYFVDSEKYFYPILLHMYMSTFIVVATLFSHDFMYITKVHHACTLFHLAGYHLNSALTQNSPILSDNSKQNRSENVPIGVQRHRKALQYVADINECYEWNHFCVIFLFIIALSVALYSAAAYVGQWNEMVKNVIYVFGQITMVFMVNYPAQLLIDESAGVFHKIYGSEWYAAPVATQKLMILIMRKSMAPTTILVGKKYALSLEAYGTMIQTSVSYFMVLLSFK